MSDLGPERDGFQVSHRYFGMDSGSTLFAGISNPSNVVKVGQSQEYTVGFRANTALSGSIYYELER